MGYGREAGSSRPVASFKAALGWRLADFLRWNVCAICQSSPRYSSRD